MADLYYPPAAQQAALDAQTLRQHYHQAVAKVRERAIPRPDKERILRELHAAHAQRMRQLRAAWHDAFVNAEHRARKQLMSDKLIRTSRITMDSYRAHLQRLQDKPVNELAEEFELARMLDDPVVMRAAAVAALNRRLPGPGDHASRLVARFAYASEPDGHGRLRYMFPEAAGAWEELQGLEAWTATDRANEEGKFSVPGTPEKPTDPRPIDPAEAARQAVAQLYPASNGPVVTSSNGQTSDAPASAP